MTEYMSMTEYRCVVSATMIYDSPPINGVFFAKSMMTLS